MAICSRIMHNPYFVFVECIIEGSSAQNLMKVIMNFQFNVRGLIEVEVPFRLLCFGVDGVSTFQGVELINKLINIYQSCQGTTIF